MENFSNELISTITDYYSRDGNEGREITRDILYYLYHTTNDNLLKRKIVEWYNTENFCITCKSELVQYHWKEKREDFYEDMYVMDCPVCNRKDYE